MRVRYFFDGPGRLIGREAPNVGQDPDVSAWHSRDLLERDALGRVTGSKSWHGALASPVLIVEETFLQDSLGRTHRESFRYGSGGSNWTDVVSSYAGSDLFRSGLGYQNNLGGGLHDLAMSYTADPVGRLQQIQWQATGGTMVPLAQYWHQGSAISRRDTFRGGGSWKTDYRYDAYGRMDRIEHRVGAAVPFSEFDFVYDLASNLVKEVYRKQNPTSGPGEGDRFAYDEHHRLAKAWIGADPAKMAAADPEAPNTGTVVQKLTYGLDAANNRTQVLDQQGGTTWTNTYTVQEAAPQGPSNRYETVNGVGLVHDERGNTVFDGSLYYVFDDRNRLTEVWTLEDTEQALQSSGLSSSTVERRATGGGRRWRMQDRAAVADARRRVLERVPGGMSSVLSRHAVPEFRRQLQERLPRGALRREPAGPLGQAQASGEPEPEPTMQLVAVYLYDAFDRRVVRMVIGVQTWMYAYDRWEEVQELELGFVGSTLSALPVLQSVWGEQLDELVAFRRRSGSAWSERYVAEGGAHCPARVLDAAGNVLEVQEYDPYGSTRFYSGGVFTGYTSLSGNPFHWKGHRFDPETGLVYMRHRHYSPWLGRFVSQDPLGVWEDSMAKGNDYSYATGRPLTMSDPMGLQVNIWIGGLGDDENFGNLGSVFQEFGKKGAGAHRFFAHDAEVAAYFWAIGELNKQIAIANMAAWALRQCGVSTPVPSQPTLSIVGYSLGGARAQVLADMLARLGYRVHFLVTLDPVGPKAGLVTPMTLLDPTGSGLVDEDTYWVNSYSMDAIDVIVDVPIVGRIGGPLLGWTLGVFGLTNTSDNVAHSGDRQGHEARAQQNIDNGKLHHSDARGYFEKALEDPQLRTGFGPMLSRLPVIRPYP